MFKIALINMPFADANRPSLSLTQLRQIVTSNHPVEVDIQYFNQEFTKIFGLDLYKGIAEQYTKGLGDWMFRHLAFPDEPDNTEKYLIRHFPGRDPESVKMKELLLQRRSALSDDLDALIDKYQLQEASLVGFTSMFSQNTACFALANKLKQQNPDVITVMGGANCETPMGEEIAKNVPQIDFVFSGPAAVSFDLMVGHILNNDLEACHSLDGVFSNTSLSIGTNVVRIGKELPLDNYIPLDYSSFITTFDNNFPELSSTKHLLFETSRGCWWGERSHCTFCGLNSESMNYRAMGKDVAIEQFEAIFEYADNCSYFSCVDNILSQKYTKDVVPHISPPEDISIFYEVKPSLKEHEIKLLADKRINVVQPGIESLSTSTLKLMKKGSNAFGNITFLKHCLTHGVTPEWNLLVGFPKEKEAVYKKYMQDLPLLVHLPPPGGCFPVRFDRYSPYFNEAVEYKLDLAPYEFYYQIYPFDEKSIENIAYYFQDRNYAASYATDMWKWISKLTQNVSGWNDAWSAKGDQQLPPELYFKGNNLIYDSRFGEPREIVISDHSMRVLHELDKPRSMTRLSTSAFGIEGFDPQKEIEVLLENNLIFHEDGKYLNLVMADKAPTSHRFLMGDV